MNKQNKTEQSHKSLNNSPLESGQSSKALHSFPLSKGMISFCSLLLFLITISGSSALLSSPIHPIGLVLGILIPAYLFLLFALIRQHSLFSTLLFFLQKQLLKLQAQTSEKLTKNSKTTFQIDPKTITLLTKMIMHGAWIIIFISLLIGLFFQLTLKQYQFNLHSTLFPDKSGIYLQIIQIFNYLPNIIFSELIPENLIINSLQGNLSPAENAIWAKWILLMIGFYGLLPRMILSLVSYYQYRRYQTSLMQQSLIISGDPTITDPAIHRPISERPPKAITTGIGEMQIALDFAYPLNSHITVINDRTDFADLKNRLTNSPLKTMILYIDSSLTPDRSLLRRIYSLLNCAVNNTIVLVDSESHSRLDEWQQKITPNLEANEVIQTKHLLELQ